MKEARYFYVPDAAQAGQLPHDEATHAVKVLRLQPGDDIYLIDGKGTFYAATVTIATAKLLAYRVVEALPQQRQWRGRIHLAIAPTKMMDRVEWMAEKATEVGFDALSFIDCRFSERRIVKVDRVERIVVSAVKQSRKPWMPEVNPMVSFADFIRQPRQGTLLIAHCYDEVPRTDLFDYLSNTDQEACQDVTVLIGPEGDFSIDEVREAVDCGFVSVSLGTSRLRTETAALAAVMMAHLARRVAPTTQL